MGGPGFGQSQLRTSARRPGFPCQGGLRKTLFLLSAGTLPPYLDNGGGDGGGRGRGGGGGLIVVLRMLACWSVSVSVWR